MGTVNATLLSIEPITTWVNASFSWSTSSRWEFEVVKPSLAPRQFACLYAVCGVFPVSRGVLFLTQPEEVGGNEVKE
jgi:hypothetical protein